MDIVLSRCHPSLLETAGAKGSIFAPLVVNQQSLLVDGYRRYLATTQDELPVIEMDLPCVYDAAFQMNRNTRDWDEIDSFLWSRWAESLGVSDHQLPFQRFPPELEQATPPLLHALADRKMTVGQAVRILQTPPATWPFFVEVLSSKVQFNVNETAAFIDMTFDLANREGIKNLEQVFQEEPLQSVFLDPSLPPKQRGEHLLKGMRSLRYPLYHRKSEELASAWNQLSLQKWQAKKGLLLEKGVLEITIRAHSQEDFTRKVRELFESISSPDWSQIWEL